MTLPELSSQQIRETFLRHFAERNHTVVPSASLIADDPTLLLVNAGMVPFKPYFLGDAPPPYTPARATSVQKVVRTNDIENVGRTTRHNSFFEMCGNFSFGDYFKTDAITFAWELLTGPFGFSPEQLWATVYQDDDEALALWRRYLPAERVQRRGKEDNFWSMGVPGPCGPCSELYYDRGPEHGRDGGPIADETRYLEVWNLVFMQFERGPGAGYEYPILRDLPRKNIDTGMGLERMAALLQGADNVYETDLLRPLLNRAVELTGTRYGADPANDVALRVIAEHGRTVTMLIGDGIVPANEGRGYVLRRMLRRVVRNVRLLGGHDPVMRDIVGAAAGVMAPGYPELTRDLGRIADIAAAEEESFLATLTKGSTLFDTYVAETRSAGSRAITGDKAFTLHDTYGFPIDLTLEMASEAGLSVDEDGFRRLMAEQRTRAKADSRAKKSGHADLSVYRSLLTSGPVEFTGYTEIARESRVRGVVPSAGGSDGGAAGDLVEIVLDITPFYAEGGGQLADQGIIRFDSSGTEGVARVVDVQSPLPGLVVHRAQILSGEVLPGATAFAEVDVERRNAISRAHTATHLVHKAMRDALGESATQAGSENAPGRFRFDFASPSAVPHGVLADVEAEVNQVLLDDLEVRWFYTTQDEARRLGAMMLFGEKYGEQVRIVEVGEYARELCGGTHVARSAQLGMVKLLGEASVGAGVRRVEALVGADAYRFLARESILVAQLAELVKSPRENLVERIAERLDALRAAEKEIDRLRADQLAREAGALADGAVDVDGIAVLGVQAPEGVTGKELQRLAVDLRSRWDGAGQPSVVAVAAVAGAKLSLVVTVNPAARGRGLSAVTLFQAIAPVVSGRGGGKPDLAQGGGTEPAALPAAFARLQDEVRGAVGAGR